jgi:hypothetical protein
VASIYPLLDVDALPLSIVQKSTISPVANDTIHGQDEASSTTVSDHQIEHDIKTACQRPLERMAINCQNQYEVQRELQYQAAVVHLCAACQPLHQSAAKAVYVYRRLRTCFVITSILTVSHRVLRWVTRHGWLSRWFTLQQLRQIHGVTHWLAVTSMAVLAGWYWWQCRSVGSIGWWRAMNYRYVTTPPVTVHTVSNSKKNNTSDNNDNNEEQYTNELDENESPMTEHFLVHQRVIAHKKLHRTGTVLDLFPIRFIK